jgi:hypothetical protein
MPEGAFYGQEATMPEAILPVRCTFRIKTGAFYGQEAVFIGVRARSDPARKVHLGIKNCVNGYETRCSIKEITQIKSEGA